MRHYKYWKKPVCFFDSEEALNILAEAGCSVDRGSMVVRFPKKIVEDALDAVPESFQLYDRDGENPITIGGNCCYFDPGSAGLNFLEGDGITAHPAISKDIVNIYKVTDALENYPIQTTAVSLDDVPKEITDCYRVYLMLKNTKNLWQQVLLMWKGLVTLQNFWFKSEAAKKP